MTVKRIIIQVISPLIVYSLIANVFSQTDDTTCTSNPCMYGNCFESSDIPFYCSCHTGYIGEKCDIILFTGSCSVSQCENGRTCFTHIDGHTCQCPLGFTGNNCMEGPASVQPPILTTAGDSKGSEFMTTTTQSTDGETNKLAPLNGSTPKQSPILTTESDSKGPASVQPPILTTAGDSKDSELMTTTQSTVGETNKTSSLNEFMTTIRSTVGTTNTLLLPQEATNGNTWLIVVIVCVAVILLGICISGLVYYFICKNNVSKHVLSTDTPHMINEFRRDSSADENYCTPANLNHETDQVENTYTDHYVDNDSNVINPTYDPEDSQDDPPPGYDEEYQQEVIKELEDATNYTSVYDTDDGVQFVDDKKYY